MFKAGLHARDRWRANQSSKEIDAADLALGSSLLQAEIGTPLRINSMDDDSILGLRIAGARFVDDVIGFFDSSSYANLCDAPQTCEHQFQNSNEVEGNTPVAHAVARF